MKGVTRRDFLRTTSGIAVGAGLGVGCATHPQRAVATAAASTGKATPSEKIVLGFVGVAGRGTYLMERFGRQPDVEIGAVCDVYQTHLDAAVARTNGKAKAYRDFRDLVEQKDLDAVVVATPPHWHALVTIAACDAGKDVYCEKPMCLKPVEGRAIVNAARRNGRITQVGTQIHAEENYRRVVEIVRSGILGPLSAVRTQINLNEAPDGIGRPADCPPPDGLDWNMWLGPAPEKPFNPARFEDGKHRYFADYVGSWLHEIGPHVVDLFYWACEPGPPKAVTAMGGKFATNDISTIPDTMEVLYEYPEYIMTWTNMCANSHGLALHRGEGMARRLGVTFHGVNGTLLADYGWHELVSEGDRLKDVALPDPWLPSSPGHEREFLDCIKSRERPSCDVENHYPLHVALNLGNLAYQLGRRIEWDAEREEVKGDREANELLKPNYRAPWTLPL